MISAILIDDENDSLDVLEYEINANCPEVEIIDKFNDPSEAYDFLQSHAVDVVFLDISMPAMNGFDFLATFSKIPFEVIFVTAYEEYALSAFDFYALDYLVKPVPAEKLVRAVERLKVKISVNQPSDFEKIKMLLANIQSSEGENASMAVPTLEGYEMVEINEIVFLEADGNYTTLHLKNKPKVLISKNLKEFEKVLSPRKFTRIHHSHMVNVAHVKKYFKGDGGAVVLSDGTNLAVSRANKAKLLSMIKISF